MSGAPVLLVDDNPDDVLLTRRALQRCRETREVLVAGTGEEALEILHGDPGNAFAAAARPALVLLDLKQPGIDGIEVLRRIRADARTRTVPVIVLTSSRVPEDVDACYALGANSFLQKAVDFDRFQEGMRVFAEYWLAMNVAPGPAA